MKLREKTWLWGLNPGADHYGDENGLVGYNRMTPFEGAYYFGTKNLIRAERFGFPKAPLDGEAERFDALDKTVWTVDPTRPETIDEIIRVAKYHKNIKGAIIHTDVEMYEFSAPDISLIAEARRKLKEALGNEFLIWIQFYGIAVDVLKASITPYFELADVICFFNRGAIEIHELDNYLASINRYGGKEKKIIWGAYFWDFQRKTIMSPASVRCCLDKYRQWIKAGSIDGMILYSNTLADINLAASYEAKKWMEEHGDEEVEEETK